MTAGYSHFLPFPCCQFGASWVKHKQLNCWNPSCLYVYWSLYGAAEQLGISGGQYLALEVY